MKTVSRNTIRARAAAGVAVVVAGVAIAGIAVAAQSGDTTQQRFAQATVAAQPSTMPSEEAAAFGILRASSQAVPDAVTDAFAHAPQYAGAFAPNPKLARALKQTNPYTGTAPWVVPADGGLCLYVPDTDGTSATTCNTLDEAKAGGLHLVLAPFGKASYVVGIVPDGVTSVSVTNADGSSVRLPVNGNTYGIRSADARSIAVGKTVVKVPQAPAAPPVPQVAAG